MLWGGNPYLVAQYLFCPKRKLQGYRQDSNPRPAEGWLANMVRLILLKQIKIVYIYTLFVVYILSYPFI